MAVSPAAERGQLLIFPAVPGGGGGGGGGTEEADPAGSHTGAGFPGAPEGKGAPQGQAAGLGGVWGLPTTLLGRPAKANSTGQFLERDVGVSEVEKELASSIHDVTGPAPALAQAPALPPPLEGQGHPGIAQSHHREDSGTCPRAARGIPGPQHPGLDCWGH